MLRELSIRHFAIIDDLSLTLAPGMTVLSGETGAGKSILVDALGLLLGDRADSDAVRDGQPRAEISAAFSLEDADAARAWLTERALDDGDECLVRRVVARTGRSRNWINGSPASARDLKALGGFLVDIYGQHAHQSLVNADTQRELLDDNADCQAALAMVAATAAQLRHTQQRIRALENADGDGNLRRDLLGYQVDELQALDLGVDEVAALDAEHQRLANAERLLTDGQQALTLLSEAEDIAADATLARAARLLGQLAAVDAGFAEAAEMSESARIQTQEAGDSLRRMLDGIALDPARLAQVETRQQAIQDMARKHRCTPEELTAIGETLAAELAELDSAEASLATLRTEQTQLQSDYRRAADALHAARNVAAEHLAAAVTANIRELGMPDGVFEVAVEARGHTAPSASGDDLIIFRVSANPGQAPRSLEKTASGGELSRISLAIQVVAVTATRVPTLVFDEVDAGIGGGVAEIVGRQLRRLGAAGQTLCVTHLPQVAAQAQQHLQVAKTTAAGRTRTQIEPLAGPPRVEELARMLGGVDITARTRAHAREMIERAAG